MKNLFTNLAAFCLGSLICVTIIACANDIDDNSDNSIALLSNQIKDLSERLTSLEKNVGEIKEDMENIENELDYEIVFQKFNSYFNGEEYKAEIDAIKEQLNSMSGGGQELPQLANITSEFLDGEYYSKDGWDFEYDDNGRMIKLIIREDYDDGTIIFNITYSENKCIVKYEYTGGYDKYTITLKDNEIDNPQAINYLILHALGICDFF